MDRLHEGERPAIHARWPLELEDVACDLCGSHRRDPLATVTDFRYSLPGHFTLQRCHSCSLVYLSPRPAKSSLSLYYPSDYRPHADSSSQHTGRLGAALRRLIFGGNGLTRRALAWLYNSVAFRAFLQSDKPGCMLDIGCGAGSYLRACQDLGWDVEGVESSADASERARRALSAPIYTGFVEDVELRCGHYDLVTMVHSLEHTRSPRRVVKIAFQVLKPGGALLIMVPNFSSWDRLVFGQRWYPLEVPRHLYHFEPITLAALLRVEGFVLRTMGGSAHADVVVRNIRYWLGSREHDYPAGRIERFLVTALLLPLAALRRSPALWVLATRPH